MLPRRDLLEGARDPEALDALIQQAEVVLRTYQPSCCLLYTSPSPRDLSTSRMPSSA